MKKNQSLKPSSSFVNDDAGIKKRMEEITRYYSGNHNKRNSEPIIISNIINNFTSNNNNSNNNNHNKLLNKKNISNNMVFEEKSKFKLKMNKDILNKMKGRCLSAQRYDNINKEIINKNKNNTKIVELFKQNIKINKKLNNATALSHRKKDLYSTNKFYNDKSKKITINDFTPTSLFPKIDKNNNNNNEI